MQRALKAVQLNLPSYSFETTVEGQSGLAISAGGGLRLVEGEAAVRQSIKLLLSTRPGERVMRPDYGCPLHRLAFEPNDAATAGLAMHYIRQALTLWEPRVEVLSLTADHGAVDDQRGHLTIHLQYRIISSGHDSSLSFDLNLDGRGENAISNS